MFFSLSKIYWLLLKPSHLFLSIITVLLVIFLWNRRRSIGINALFLLFIFIILGLAPAGNFLIAPLENRIKRPASLPARIDGIIVLGGAQESSITAARDVLALTAEGERLIEAAVLMQRHDEAKLVFSGGSGQLFGAGGNENLVNEKFAQMLQLDPERIIYERRSRNTYENAIFSKELVQPAASENWILVTSALHMPRSFAIFEHIGWRVIPWPADYQSTPSIPPGLDLSIVFNWDKIDRAVREYTGLLVYWITGRTSTLFPLSPETAKETVWK